MIQTQEHRAFCRDCKWRGDTTNSHPNAKRHARVYNHNVTVLWIFNYDHEEKP